MTCIICGIDDAEYRCSIKGLSVAVCELHANDLDYEHRAEPVLVLA